MKNIRNFAIIAHVDHGKSTLADRFLELTGTISGKHEAQMLDKNPISRERGITIKLAPVRMTYTMRKSEIRNPKNETNSNSLEIRNSDLEIGDSKFILNLIDTPGHVDFSYEVERTLACVEGVILLVDATQGIQAQTIAHTYKAIEQNLTIIPVVNKIDVLHAKIAQVKQELADFLGVDEAQVYEISAKTGKGVEELLKAVILKVPSPMSSVIARSEILRSNSGQAPQSQEIATLPMVTRNDKAQALIFDSYYDKYRGVIAFVRVFGGEFRAGMKGYLHATGTTFEINEVGNFIPDLDIQDKLDSGSIGYIITNLKDIHLCQVGDSITDSIKTKALPGYKKIQPMVFSSIFPTDPDAYVELLESMEKLTLNDSAITYEPIYSTALGSGLRVGFLGLLHADVVRQRLEREYELSIVLTSPIVKYEERRENGKIVYYEPIAIVDIVTPQDYVGAVMRLAEQSRAVFLHMDNKSHVYLSYEIPMSELMGTFFDRLKTLTSGYASLQWDFKEYRQADADKLTLLLNSEPVEEFSEYAVAEKAYVRASDLTSKLKELIPRQQYEVKIQAKFKGKIIASSRISPFRKDVTQKLYGGDRTRKDKLLKKQKAGKKDLKNIGSVEIPKEVFLKLFQNKN